MSLKKISIIGAGQAAAYAANEIRKHDKELGITIFNEENFSISILIRQGRILLQNLNLLPLSPSNLSCLLDFHH